MNAAIRPNLTDEMTMQRLRMAERLRDHYKIADERVLEVMTTLPRHLFVPEAIKSQAYNDNALPISGGQTISQPFIVARMTELLGLTGQEKVLEIGAGSGYQTAVLASLARKVFAIERLPVLAEEANHRLQALGFRNFTLKAGDGTEGWDAYMPFDAILVAADGSIGWSSCFSASSEPFSP
ncbi:MAG: protein-L-isoaspartate(D-aspartate) O-methyltransferase, partial [Acidobacteriota bacterium]